MSTDTGTQDLKEFIRATLVEPPGKLSKELIKLCEGLIAIEPESKSVRMLKTKLTEQQQVAVLCLGYWILSFLMDSPSLSEVPRDTLVKQTGLEPNTISAYASTLKQMRILDNGATRGTYRIVLAKAPEFVRAIRGRISDTVDKEDHRNGS